jgi:hypothetical protein
MKNPLACIAYGSTPRDPQEAFYNRQTAETIESALKTLGWKTRLLGLTNTDSRPIPPEADLIFNLCDGDEESRFEIVQFAKELESLHKPPHKTYTGSSPKILQYCKDKTLKWMKSCPVPKYWDTPPADPHTQKFLTKPREAHGSLLITEENINGTHNFSPKDYFFQEYLEGPEYTTIFINNKFLGQALGAARK